ncbi:Kinetochore scaffold 1 [Merluccius polli]|uniref:Kinetochore scaffold 1 n=1 Tax=Merluccius polli TaxID=89951 RepID=A0AA47N591_MERPO|nr:Kinetochore scaffold 1 [Merluccius polli]
MIDNFVDEVLPNISSDEDLSGSLVTENPQSTSEDGSPLQERDVQGTSEEEVWKLSPGHPSVAQGKKRPSPVDGEDTMVTEKMRRPSLNSTIEMNVDDESITVLEFFKLFDIDFVIHNPRQSILPGKLASHLDHTPEELLKNRHINHPKQRVYELDHQNLAVKVERLKARMKDQGRLLHTVNKPLWEELICFSDEELKCFGAKLKENSNFFRKRSKAQSDEMKEVLYSNLLQATLEEQQKLREKLEEADGMLKGLDDCIQELETGNETLEEIHLPLVQHSPPFKPNVVINVNLLIVVSQNLQQLKGAV